MQQFENLRNVETKNNNFIKYSFNIVLNYTLLKIKKSIQKSYGHMLRNAEGIHSMYMIFCYFIAIESDTLLCIIITTTILVSYNFTRISCNYLLKIVEFTILYSNNINVNR